MSIPHQQGIASITAIFVLVVLATIGAAALHFSSVQQLGSIQDLQASQALYAARSGLEWGAYRHAHGQNCNANFTAPATAASLTDFTVSVVCTEVTDALGGRPTGVVRIIATACNEPNTACPNTTNPSALYVERQVEMLF